MKGESASGDKNPLSEKDSCRNLMTEPSAPIRRPEIVRLPGLWFRRQLRSLSPTRLLTSYPNSLVMNDSPFGFLRQDGVSFLIRCNGYSPLREIFTPALLRICFRQPDAKVNRQERVNVRAAPLN